MASPQIRFGEPAPASPTESCLPQWQSKKGAEWAGDEFETAEMAQVKESLSLGRKKFCSTEI